MPSSHTAATVDVSELEAKVKSMYRAVADDPLGRYHFELGRSLAERLGYDPKTLDQIPAEAVDSFAGVGHFFDLVQLEPSEQVLDLGAGSGMDVFYAANQVGDAGRVVGIDMTPEQLAKSRRLRAEMDKENVEFVHGRIQELPFPDGGFDAVISNGVINLVADKARVFAEAHRVLRPGGRFAVADIVTEHQLTPQIVANSDLWASCIGGAAHQDLYQAAIEAAGFRVEMMRYNRSYRFLSEQAVNASERFGVKSICILARKPEVL